MTTGKQLVGLLLLTTALTFPGMASAQGTTGPASPAGAAQAPTEASSDQELLDQVEGTDAADAQAEEPEISIPGGAIIVTGRVRRDPTRDSTQVVSVLSTEQIARTGEGDIAGALGRVTGLSVVGNGRVYVRGLGDRYSLALLNGLPLPSPEPLSRVVPLDIFPTNVIASTLVQKTYSPNFPGEFGGGVINLTTRAVPDESFLTIGGGISGDTETTFQNSYAYFGSQTDWTGFDDGTRDLSPQLSQYLSDSIANGTSLGSMSQAERENIARTLTPPQFAGLQIIDKTRANFSAGLTAGTAFDVGGDARLGLVLTGNLSNKYRNRDITRQEAGNTNTSYSRNENDFVTDNNILANALFSAGLEFGEHTVRWTNLFIRDTVKQARLSSYKIADVEEADFLRQNTAWYERQLIDTQLVGEFKFGPLSLDLRGGYARTDREAPYNLTYTYARTNNPADRFGDVYRIDLSGAGQQALQESGVSVSFSDLNETLWFGGLDASYEVMPDLTLTAGYAYTDTDRYTERRAFEIRATVDRNFNNPNGDPSIPPIDPSLVPALNQALAAVGARRPFEMLNGAVYNLFDVNLLESGSTTPAFSAALKVHAGYGQLQWAPTAEVTVQGGVRYESAEQSSIPLGANNTSKPRTNKKDYFLPALTVTWEPIDDLQLRASGSRTLARPQFRELISQLYYDPETNRSYSGNPNLNDSKLLNFEARAEYYLTSQSRLSLAGFYKKIDSPIEAFMTGDGSISYANAPEANLYGAELEAQYFYDLVDWGGWFETKQLVLIGNYTYTQSKLKVGDETILIDQGGNASQFPANQIFTDGAPLVGQSDHLLNLQLGLEDTDKLQQLTLLVSYASKRPTFRSQGGLPDVIEKPGVSLDAVVRQGFTLKGTEAELKLEARNILGTRHQEYQVNANGLRIDNNTYDVGQTFAASLSFTF
ncbi:TonB-dependent receptor domain-containing protein [Altererythrobacter sp. B11]|uniref:TonB-dependent receptor domain-containing protein n=1 Tax=Altererythrobacter sp. B11 TaxID=2060312 RepID=UPI000E5A41F0|nr:TonB-dependent receptor [Altererythrobacter sp. B11]